MKVFKQVIGLLILVSLTSCQAMKLLKVSPYEVNDQLTIVLGGGGNSAVLFSKNKHNVLIVDTKNGSGARKLKRLIDERAPGAKVIIINTHFHKDHVSGNKLYSEKGLVSKHIMGNYSNDQWMDETNQNLTEAVEKMKAGSYKKISFGGENVHIFSIGQGHTWSDIIIYFEKAKTLMTGDLVFNNFHPVIHSEEGADIESWIIALDEIMIKFEDIRVIPGHGTNSDMKSIIDQKQYLMDLADVKKGQLDWKAFKEKYRDIHSIPFISGLKYSKRLVAD